MLLEEELNVKTKILNAIMDDPEIILFLKERYVNDEIWKYCIEREPSLFRKMKHPSSPICLFACEIDGSNLRWVRNKFSYIPITEIMVHTAVKSNSKAILYVPKKMLNEELKEMAFEEDPSLMEKFDFVRPEFIEMLVKRKPYALRYVKNIDEDIICEMLKANPNIIVYVNTVTDKMLSTLEQCFPNYYELYYQKTRD